MAAAPAVGASAPDFTATTDTGATVRLADFRGKRVILYPRNNQGRLVHQASIGYTPRQFWLTQ